jgi:chromosome segregation ATPase
LYRRSRVETNGSVEANGSADTSFSQLRAENARLAEMLLLARLELKTIQGSEPKTDQEIEAIDSISWARSELESLGRKLIAGRTQLANLKIGVTARKDEIKTLEKSLFEGCGMRQELIERVEEERSKSDRLRDERIAFETATELARAESEQLVEEQQEARFAWEETQAQLQAACESLDQLRSKIEISERRLEARNTSLASAHEEHTCLLAQLASVRTSIAVCENDAVEKSNELRLVEEAIVRETADKESLDEEVDQARSLRMKMSEQIEELRRQLEFSSDQLREVKQRHRGLEEDLEGCETPPQRSLEDELELLGFKIRELRHADDC